MRLTGANAKYGESKLPKCQTWIPSPSMESRGDSLANHNVCANARCLRPPNTYKPLQMGVCGLPTMSNFVSEGWVRSIACPNRQRVWSCCCQSGTAHARLGGPPQQHKQAHSRYSHVFLVGYLRALRRKRSIPTGSPCHAAAAAWQDAMCECKVRVGAQNSAVPRWVNCDQI